AATTGIGTVSRHPAAPVTTEPGAAESAAASLAGGAAPAAALATACTGAGVQAAARAGAGLSAAARSGAGLAGGAARVRARRPAAEETDGQDRRHRPGRG